MNKVFVLVELYTFEFATEYKVTVYADREKAKVYFNHIVRREKEDSWINSISEDKLCEYYDEERLSYDAYEDGNAAEYNTTICVIEKEIL